MRFRDFLIEMPLANFKVQLGDEEQRKHYTTGFNKLDAAILSNNKTGKNKLASQLETVLDRTGFNFNIVFLEMFNMRLKLNDSKVEFVKKYLADNDIPVAGHITFVKPTSSGDPLTPWMVLHTIAHSIFEDSMGYNMNNMRSIIHNVLINLISNKQSTFNHVSKIMHFKSARDIGKDDGRTFYKPIESGDWDELIHELFADYLWHGGKVRLGYRKEIQEELREIPPEKIMKAQEQIQYFFDNILKSCVGKILIDQV